MIPSLQSNHNITHIFPQFQALLSTQEILVSPSPLVQLLNQPLSQPHGPTLRAVRSSTSTWPASVPLSSRQIINCLQGATWELLQSSRALRICMTLWRGVQTIANLPVIVSINIVMILDTINTIGFVASTGTMAGVGLCCYGTKRNHRFWHCTVTVLQILYIKVP